MSSDNSPPPQTAYANPQQQSFFFFNDTATTEIYTSSHTLSLHDALPIYREGDRSFIHGDDHVSLNEGRSEEHTSELQSRELISYAVFCLKKKKKKKYNLKHILSYIYKTTLCEKHTH